MFISLLFGILDGLGICIQRYLTVLGAAFTLAEQGLALMQQW